MIRFDGRMPECAVKKSETFLDEAECVVRIEAGPNGWTVIRYGVVTHYADQICTTDWNFKDAYNHAVDAMGPLRKQSGVVS